MSMVVYTTEAPHTVKNAAQAQRGTMFKVGSKTVSPEGRKCSMRWWKTSNATTLMSSLARMTGMDSGRVLVLGNWS